MIRSMTGYGKGNFENDKYKLEIEIKSVNHRYNDIILKMPKKFFQFEDFIKSEIKKDVKRGRVEVYFNFVEIASDNISIKPNFAVIDKYYDAYSKISKKYDLKDKPSLSLLTKNQDSFIIEIEEDDEKEVLEVLKNALRPAITNLIDMRNTEGEKLLVDIMERIKIISELVEIIENKSPEILINHKNKMRERVNEILDKIEIDDNRLAQEIAIYADKTNVTEEIVRLKSHFKQFELIINQGGDVGRKLDFLVQELNREVNTIGSKSPDIDISNYVVNMKSEIEKIREQIQNLE